MKYLAVFDDGFLSNFRLDDCGLTLVLTDKRGATRAVKLTPLERPMLTITEGNSVYLTQAHMDALMEYEQHAMTAEAVRQVNNSIQEAIDNYSEIAEITRITGKKVEPIAIGQGCWKCPSHTKCFDAFQLHSYKCNHYDKTEEEFKEWLFKEWLQDRRDKEWLQDRREKSGE